MSGTTSEIILKDGQFMRRDTTEYSLGQQDAILQQLVDQQPIMLPYFMPFGDQKLHLLISKTSIVVATELKQLPFKTWWKLLPGGKDLTPTWTDTGLRGCVRIDDPWVMPANLGQLIFAVKFARGTGRPTPENGLLYVYRNKELFHLPYPNNYEDGRICMGDEWDRNRATGKDLVSDFLHAHTSFHSTIANSHLIVPGRTDLLFKRNLDGWITPTGTVFASCLRATAPAFMQGFSLT